MAIIRLEKWCVECSAMKLQLKTSQFWLCLECWARNDGRHPAEDCLAVKQVQEENRNLLRKNANKQRVFPKLLHTQHKRTTCRGSRSIKLQMFGRK